MLTLPYTTAVLVMTECVFLITLPMIPFSLTTQALSATTLIADSYTPMTLNKRFKLRLSGLVFVLTQQPRLETIVQSHWSVTSISAIETVAFHNIETELCISMVMRSD